MYILSLLITSLVTTLLHTYTILLINTINTIYVLLVQGMYLLITSEVC